MADQKISQLNELSSPTGSDIVPIVNNSETKKITVDNLLSGSNVRPYFISTDTNTAENFKVGDNVWLGDVGSLNTLVIKGVQDSGSSYIKFGNGTNHQHPYLGHDSNEDANVLSVVADTTKISNSTIIGPGSLQGGGNQEMLHVFVSESFNIPHFIGNNDTYSQIIVQNNSSNSGASSDVVCVPDNGDESNHYVNMGINSSGWLLNTSSIGYQNDGYLYNVGQDLYIGSMFPSSPDHGHVHIFSESDWQNPSINIVESGSVAFGTGSVTDGYKFEFSGSVKFNNKINIGSVLSLDLSDPLPSGTLGSLAVSGSNIYFHNGQSWRKMSLEIEPSNNILVNNISGPEVGSVTGANFMVNGSFPLTSGNTISGIGTISIGDPISIQINGSQNFKIEFYKNTILELDTSGTVSASVDISSSPFEILSTDQLEIKITTY